MTDFDEDNIRPIDRVRNISRMLFFLFIFLLGIKGLGNGFSLLGGDLLDNIFQAMENPFLGLIVGVLTTSMVQSSSVTTSLIVGLVAAPVNPLPIANAIPMIMGANFGTSITNTIVALGHAGHKDEFKRAFAVSTCDDFFDKPGRQVGRLGHFLRSLAVLWFPGAGRIHVRIIWLND